MSDCPEEIAARFVIHIHELLEGPISLTAVDMAQEPEPQVGRVLGALVRLSDDITSRDAERLRVEEELKGAVERLEEQNGLLEKRQAEIADLVAELSTPIIKVWEG